MPTAETVHLRRTPVEPEAGYQLHHVRVSEVRALSPSFLRVTFTGPDLDRVGRPGLDQRIKLILPVGERGLAQLPMTVDWYAAWRELSEGERNPIRTYTIRNLRPEARELDIDVVRHGTTGPAGRWIEQVAVGDEILVCAPNREAEEDPGGYDFAPPDSWDRLLLAGDETAVPALASILEALPEGAQATVVVEVPDVGDRDALPDRPDLDVRVVPRGDSGRGESFETEVRAAAASVLADTPTQDDQALPDVDVDVDLLWESVLGEDRREAAEVYAWLAGEAAVIKRLRRHLVADLGLDRRCVAFMGYWREGRTEDD